MRRRQFPTLLAAAAIVPAPAHRSAAQPAEVRVLSAGAMEPGVEAALARFRATSAGAAVPVRVGYATAPQIRERLAAGAETPPDLLIGPVMLINELASAGRLAGERAALGRVGIGVAVRPDAPAGPDISDLAAFRRAVEEAERVVYNRASTGLHLDRLFERMGLAAAVAPKSVRYATGAEVMRHVLNGQGGEIALGPVTEILMVPGLRYAGPLPAEAQNHTAYAAALMPGAAPAAAALLDFLSGPDGRAALATAGIEPVP